MSTLVHPLVTPAQGAEKTSKSQLVAPRSKAPNVEKKPVKEATPQAVSSDPTLTDEEGDTPSTPPLPEGVERLEGLDEILWYSSVYKINRVQPLFYFVGKGKKDTSLYLYESQKNEITNLSEVREGYALVPLGYNTHENIAILEIRPKEKTDEWFTAHTIQRNGEQIHIANFYVNQEKWTFLEMPFLNWINPLQRFWALNARNRRHHITDVPGAHKRFVSPIQKRNTPVYLRTFIAKMKKRTLLLWIDFCKTKGKSRLCLWSMPAHPKKSFLPKIHAVLPADPKQKDHQWALAIEDGMMALTLWQAGGKVPTQRWFKPVGSRKWRRLSSSKSLDPRSNVVIVTKGKKTELYYLATSNGADAKIKKAIISKGKKKRTTTVDSGLNLPYFTDLYSIDSEHLLAFTNKAMFKLKL